MAILSIRNLVQRFAGITAIDDVSFDIEQGSIVGLIGPNGAGKTTLINTVTGYYRPVSGEISFCGHSIVGRKPHQIARAGIARTFQQIRLFDRLSIIENVMVGMDTQLKTSYAGALFGSSFAAAEEKQARDEAKNLLAQIDSNLIGMNGRRPDELPYADKRRLEIARALALKPRMVLLDEPAAGMAPQEIRRLIHDLSQIRDSGTTVLLIEHKMKVIEGVTDKVVVLDYGRKIAEGSFDKVRQNQQVVEAYLGRGYANAGIAAS